MAKRKTFDERFQGFIDNLYKDGTITRWATEKRLKDQERKLNSLDREERAIKKTIAELRRKKTA